MSPMPFGSASADMQRREESRVRWRMRCVASSFPLSMAFAIAGTVSMTLAVRRDCVAFAFVPFSLLLMLRRADGLLFPFHLEWRPSGVRRCGDFHAVVFF